MLVILIYLALPRTAPQLFGGAKAETLVEEAEGKSTRLPAKQGTEFYSVVFDAGSTGEKGTVGRGTFLFLFIYRHLQLA